MSDLSRLLGMDESDPEQQLASRLVEQDDHLLEMLVRTRRETMSQQELASRLGISQPAVQQFERRDGDPRLSTIRRYALALGLLVTHRVEPFKDNYQQVNEDIGREFDIFTDESDVDSAIRENVGRKIREMKNG